MSSFTLGINNCFAVKRWPEPDAWARLIRDDLGISLVQHSLDLVDLDAPAGELAAQAAQLRATCAHHDLTLHSTFTGLAAYSSNLLLHPDRDARLRALRWYRNVIDFTADAGAGATGGHVGAFSVEDFANPARRVYLESELRESLSTLAEYARQRGLTSLMIENLAAAREPSTMAGVRSLLDAGDAARVPIVLCLDVGHQCVAGTTGADRDPYEWLRAFGTAVHIVQIQQSDTTADHHWAFTPEHNREGRIDAGRVLSTLAEAGATDIALVLEIIPPFEQADGDVLADMVASAAYWRQHLSDTSSRRGIAPDEPVARAGGSR
jgi:D-erythrulose 1-phosphate 3-epimerase